MNPNKNFHPPFPGDDAIYYCFQCKKSFKAKVPKEGILDIFKKTSERGRVNCPDCNKPCGFDPKIKN